MTRAELAEIEKVRAAEQVEILRYGLANTEAFLRKMEGRAAQLEANGSVAPQGVPAVSEDQRRVSPAFTMQPSIRCCVGCVLWRHACFVSGLKS
jgi:hypothetical protein